VMWSSDTAPGRAAEAVRLALKDYVLTHIRDQPGLEILGQP
jgi:hypothetical protein